MGTIPWYSEHCACFKAMFMWQRALITVCGAHFANLIFQKCSERPSASIFCDFYVKSSSCYSLVRIFWTSSSEPFIFYAFYVTWSSRYNLVHICRPHLPKVLRACQAFIMFEHFEVRIECSEAVRFLAFWNKWKASSRYSPVHFLSTAFPDRAPRPLKQRPYCGNSQKPLYPQNTGLRARECFTQKVTR